MATIETSVSINKPVEQVLNSSRTLITRKIERLFGDHPECNEEDHRGVMF